MLIINEHLDRLVTAHADFVRRGMLPDSRVRTDRSPIIEVTDETESGLVDSPTVNRVTALAQTASKPVPLANMNT